MKKQTRAGLALGGASTLLLLFIGLGLAFIRANSQTSDEAVHLTAGYSYLRTGDFRLNPEHPPFIKELCALPVYLRYRLPFEPDSARWSQAEEWRIGRDFLYRSSVPGDGILETGRVPNLILGALLLALVGWWAYRLWGEWAALLAMAPAALEPNLVAHASLVTTDLGGALFVFLALYLLWEYVARPTWLALAGVGIATGLGLTSKYSVVLLVVMLLAVVGCHVLTGGSFPLPGRFGRGKKVKGGAGPRLVEAVAPVSLILFISALVIPPVYFLQGFSTWWSGLQRVLGHQELGHFAFLLGDYSQDGWWYYFPVAFLIKTPVGSLLLILASLVLLRAGRPLGKREAIFLMLPVGILFAAAATGRINIGLRHVLPVYPFLFVAASRLVTIRIRRSAMAPVLLAIPLVLTAWSALRIAPHQLAYFNELIGGPGEGYRYLSDSNIDWGQDLRGVKAYMDREKLPAIYFSYFGNVPPEVYGIRYQYVPAFGQLQRPTEEVLPPGMAREILAISVSNLQAVHFQDKNLFRWLYRRNPVEKIGYSIFVYDLTGDPEAHLRLAEVYLKAGPAGLAAPELRKALALDPSNSDAKRLLDLISQRP